MPDGTIISPHLYGYRSPPPRAAEDRVCTKPFAADWVVLAAHSDEHLSFLLDEVAPLVRKSVTMVLVIDVARQRLFIPPAHDTVDLAQASALINAVAGDELFDRHAFDALRLPNIALQCAPVGEPPPDASFVEAAERAPLRLFELCIMRGHHNRFELIGGEVPLVARMPSEKSAALALERCSADARALFREQTIERDGWHRTGVVRLRRCGALLEGRIALSPAGVRVAFEPARLSPGHDDLPSLLAVLCAAGYDGKTDLIDGRTTAAVLCRPDETQALAQRIVAEAELLGQQAAIDDGKGSNDRERWDVRVTDNIVDVRMPMRRDGLMPWRVYAGRFHDSEPTPAIVVQTLREGEALGDAEADGLFAHGAKQVWVVSGTEDRVTVLQRDAPPVEYRWGASIEAPGLLPAPVPVHALYHDQTYAISTLKRHLTRRFAARLEDESPARMVVSKEDARAALEAEMLQLGIRDGHHWRWLADDVAELVIKQHFAEIKGRGRQRER